MRYLHIFLHRDSTGLLVGVCSVFKTSEVLRLWNLNSSYGMYHALYTVMMKPFPGFFCFVFYSLERCFSVTVFVSRAGN